MLICLAFGCGSHGEKTGVIDAWTLRPGLFGWICGTLAGIISEIRSERFSVCSEHRQLHRTTGPVGHTNWKYAKDILSLNWGKIDDDLTLILNHTHFLHTKTWQILICSMLTFSVWTHFATSYTRDKHTVESEKWVRPRRNPKCAAAVHVQGDRIPWVDVFTATHVLRLCSVCLGSNVLPLLLIGSIVGMSKSRPRGCVFQPTYHWNSLLAKPS